MAPDQRRQGRVATAERSTPLPHRSRPEPGPRGDRPRPARGSARPRRFRVQRKHQNPWGQSSRHRRLNVQTSPRSPDTPFRRRAVSPFDPNRGRDAGYPAPPAQIRAGALTHTAPASGQTSAALSATCRLARLRGPQAACVTRTRHSVRYVLWPVDLPLAPVLRSIDSAGTLIPLFADFTATMTESDSSSPFVSGYDSSVFPSRPRH